MIVSWSIVALTFLAELAGSADPSQVATAHRHQNEVNRKLVGGSSTRTHYLLRTNALNYFDNFEVDTETYGNCVNGKPDGGSPLAPDAQTTRNDPQCTELGACHIGFTQVGEWVAYRFFHTEDDISGVDQDGCPVLKVNITLRVSAPGPRNVYLEIVDDADEDGIGELTASTRLTTRSLSYDDFEDITWENVQIEPYNAHILYVYFVAGNTNLCSVGISVERPQRFIPFSINALDYDRAREFDNMISGNCQDGQPPIDEPDAQNADDAECQALGPCNIAFTQPWEYVEYDFDHEQEFVIDVKDGGSYVFVDITARVASDRKKKFQMELSNGETLGPIEIFEAPGLGWQEYENVTWRMVALEANEGTHSVLVAFNEGNINMCSITVEYSRYTPPITYTALDYFNAYDSTPNNDQGGSNPTDDGVDIQRTSDEVCRFRDGSEFNVGWTDRGEFLEYRFYVSSIDEDDYDIWVRVSALRPGKKIRIDLNPIGVVPISQSFDVVSRGDFQEFTDIVWELFYLEENEYYLRVYFEDGQTNLCSVQVLPSTSRYFVFVPGTYSALFYADNSDSTSGRMGDCPSERDSQRFSSVDSIIVQDTECATARSEFDVPCSIGFTDAGEFLIYQFTTDGVNEYVNISFRVSSQVRRRRMTAELNDFGADPQMLYVYGPGKGWDTYETTVWENVYVGTSKYHSIKVTFLDGLMNLCSYGVEYAD